ncbi:MAG: response regulator transcription factor [Saprospiraceae bacterium]|nr:response regulator transcription factor [Saprospiraceae bacterium]
MKKPLCSNSRLVKDDLSNDFPNLPLEELLTQRERDVIQCISHDQNVKMIANTLSISVFTVQDHIKHIKCKMDMHTPGGIVAKAFREGLIE